MTSIRWWTNDTVLFCLDRIWTAPKLISAVWMEQLNGKVVFIVLLNDQDLEILFPAVEQVYMTSNDLLKVNAKCSYKKLSMGYDVPDASFATSHVLPTICISRPNSFDVFEITESCDNRV